MRDKNDSSIQKNFIMNFILTGSRFLFPLITFPYVSRVLLSEGNGKIAFAASVAGYFSMIAALGIPTYGIRVCAQAKDDKDELSRTVQELFLLHFIMTAIALACFILCIWIIPEFYEEKALFLVEAAGILLSVFGMEWLFQALEKYSYITIRSLVFKILSVILMFLCVHQESDYVKYSAISVFSVAGSNLFNVTQIRKYVSIKKYDHLQLKKHLKPVLILFSQSMVISVYTNLDTVMLGFMREDSQVGYYNAAVKLKGILTSLVSSLSSVLLPRMSYYYKQGKLKEYRNLALKALNFAIFISVPLSMYFSLYASDCLEFLAGKAFLPATMAMRFIVISVVPIGITGVLGIQVLISEGKEKYVLYSVIGGAVTDCILNLLWIPGYGATGAALATTVAECVVLLIQCIFTGKLLKELKREIHIKRYILLGIIALLASRTVIFAEDAGCFVRLMISAVIFGVIYVVSLLIIRDEFIGYVLRGKIKRE